MVTEDGHGERTARIRRHRSRGLSRRLFFATSLAPLLDVLFILLIFLLVSANFEARQLLEVELPPVATAESAPPIREDQRRIITLFADGSLQWNSRPVPREELLRYLDDQPAAERLLPLTLQGDARVPLGTGLALLDDLRRLGYLSCAFEVRPAPALDPATK